MKSILIFCCLILFGYQVNQAQTKECTKEEAEKCYAKGEWLQGVKYKPHPSINKEELMLQFHKNKALWEKVFIFLKETNLDTIRPGKYPIDGDNAYASVTENPTKNPENAKWEFHRKYIDIQMVIKGSEKMGIVPLSKTTESEAYNETKDVGFVTSTDGDIYTAEPGTFLIFFPSEAHRPSIKTEGCDKDKKIVIKVRVN
jgi:biofilm protein TabA